MKRERWSPGGPIGDAGAALVRRRMFSVMGAMLTGRRRALRGRGGRRGRRGRRLLGAAGAMLTLSASGLCTAAVSQAPAASARTAGVLHVNDTGHLHLLHASGEVLLEEGTASGTLPGAVKVRMVIGANVVASFTIKSRDGSIEGHGSAALHSSGRYASFGGSLSVSHGTGRYAHAHGSGGLYGVIERRTDTLTVQTTGTLHY